MRVWCILFGAVAFGAAACVPTDEALPLGSAEFTVSARYAERSLTTLDGWSLYVERYVFAFRTMTVQNLQDSDQCSYRGRGADANIGDSLSTPDVVQGKVCVVTDPRDPSTCSTRYFPAMSCPTRASPAACGSSSNEGGRTSVRSRDAVTAGAARARVATTARQSEQASR